ncbi:MAG: DMT family transporter [Planctomycetota bacterium]
MKALVFAMLAGLCWGVGEVFTKAVLHSGKVGPMTAVAVRSIVALPILIALAWGAIKITKTEPADWTKAGAGTMTQLLLGSGVIAGAGGVAFFYAALQLGEVSRVKPIAFALAPAIGALAGWLALGEAMTARKVAGLVAIVVGVVLLAGGTATKP